MPGFNLGGVAEMQLFAQWSVQPELLFSYEGTNTDEFGMQVQCISNYRVSIL
jgi:hypothetical protein